MAAFGAPWGLAQRRIRRSSSVSARGVAIYHELERRNVTLPVAEGFTGSLAGPATIQYVERGSNGSRVLAEAAVVLR